MKYKTERIINIGELEAIHTSLFDHISRLRKELESESPDLPFIRELAKTAHMEAHQAADFDFYIEQRIINED